jgi:hypothetical protein
MTTPEGKKETVREDLGYDKPYDPSQLTTDEARQLHSQSIGGPDAARLAIRAEDTARFDTSLGQPEGTHDVVKSTEQSLVATERWAERTESTIVVLESSLNNALARGDTEMAAKFRARLEKRYKTSKEIANRAERLQAIIDSESPDQ